MLHLVGNSRPFRIKPSVGRIPHPDNQNARCNLHRNLSARVFLRIAAPGSLRQPSLRRLASRRSRSPTKDRCIVGMRAGGDNCAGDPDISCGGRRTCLITIGPARQRDARSFHPSRPRVPLVVDGIVQQGENVHDGRSLVAMDSQKAHRPLRRVSAFSGLALPG